ncbi:hypothetical protein [Achromobacter pulmonis]|uniref:hypothetical protein n=1 Tax=Achromobacter pulmonis TaxID=1389932 RepID=UPI0015E82E4C|nr:hypothetical protein [Achromobacter pulmonis]
MKQVNHLINARTEKIIGGRTGKHRNKTPRKQPLLNNKLGVPGIGNCPNYQCSCGLRGYFRADYVFWLRALDRVGSARATPSSEPLAGYRVSAGSLSANKFKAARWQWAIYRSVLGLSVLRSTSCFIWYAWFAVMKRGVWRKSINKVNL